jgi:hypothetical protein
MLITQPSPWLVVLAACRNGRRSGLRWCREVGEGNLVQAAINCHAQICTVAGVAIMRSMQVSSGYRHAHCTVPRCLVERSRVHQLVGT